MITCPNCKKSGVDLVHRDEEKGTLKYRCQFCKWTETGFITRPNIIDGNECGKTILMIPESIGMGTRRLASVGNSQHVYIDQKMMDAAGVEIGDLIYVLIWKTTSNNQRR